MNNMNNTSEKYRAAALIWYGKCNGEFIYRDEPDWVEILRPDWTAKDILEDWMNIMMSPGSEYGSGDSADLIWEVKVCEFNSEHDYVKHENYTVVDECWHSQNYYRKIHTGSLTESR